MAEWKKVIVSGSSPEFGAINVDGTVTANAFVGDGSGITGISGVSDNNFTTVLKNKLDGIAASANNFTLGQATDSTLGGVIVGTGLSVTEGTVSVSQTTANDFTNALKTKLDGVEASADVTDATNVAAAGALMDSEMTDLAGVKGVTISTLQAKPSEGAFANGDKTKLDGIADSANNFTLGQATTAALGGVIVGTGLSVTEGTVSVTQTTANDFTNADHTKLDGIATGAEVNPSVGDGGLTQKNFTTTLKNKLDGIAASANNFTLGQATTAALGGVIVGTGLSVTEGTVSVSQTTANDFTNALKTKLDGIATGAEVNPSVGDGGLTQKNFTSTLKTKLDGIAASANNFTLGQATDSVLGGVIVGTGLSVTEGTVSVSQTTANDFTNVLKSKLDGIEASATADQSATEIIGLLNSDLGGNFTIGNQSSDTATFTGGVTVSGNLTVSGTTTTVDTANLNVTDQFINLNDGGSAADGGLVVEGAGVSFGWDNSAGRWAFDYSGATEGQTSITSDSFAVTVHNSDSGLGGVNDNQQQLGNIFVDSTNDVIYIYA